MNKKVLFFSILILYMFSILTYNVSAALEDIKNVPVIGDIIEWLGKPVDWPPIQWGEGTIFEDQEISQVPIYLIVLIFFALYAVFRVVSTKLPFFKETPHQNAITIFSLALSGIITTATPIVNIISVLHTLVQLFLAAGIILGIYALWVWFARSGGGALAREASRVSQLGAAERGKLAKARAQSKKEKAEAKETEREAEVQEHMVKTEKGAVDKLENMLQSEERLTGNEIQRLRWCDSALEKISRIRNAEQANRYKSIIEQQLAVIMKEITNQMKYEKRMDKILKKIRRIETLELGYLKNQDHAERQLIRFAGRFAPTRRIREELVKDESVLNNLLKNLHQIITEKETLETDIQRYIDENIIIINKRFSHLIKAAMDAVTGNNLTQASQLIHDAIGLKQKEMTVENAARNFEGKINNLNSQQQKIEEEIEVEAKRLGQLE